MKISILTNDEAQENFQAEHGLSIFINHSKYNILFDTGETKVYLKNAKKLNINLDDTDFIVLSHGHYDHTGGLRYFNTYSNLKIIILHKDAFTPKYAKENYLRHNGIQFHEEDITSAMKFYKKVSNFTKIEPFFYVLGNIKHNQDNNKYYVNGKLDDFHDELILILEENNELSLFFGCSHFGIVNGLKKVKEIFPNKRIKNLIAGMHLGSKTISEIKEISTYLNSLNLEKIMPLHCTGKVAMNYFKETFQDKCILLKAGDVLEI